MAELAAGFVALLISGAALAWMIWQTILGVVSLGDLALFYQAFNQGQRLMRGMWANFLRTASFWGTFSSSWCSNRRS